MKRLEWMGRNEDLNGLPQAAGAFFLRDAEKNLLLADCTADLAAQLNDILDPTRESAKELRDQLDYIEYTPTPDLIEAAVAMCAVTSAEQPRHQVHTDASYLGVRFHQPPYVAVQPFTLEDYYYVGPFPSRFAVHDVLATLASLRQTPACDGPNFPCERLNDKRCMGFCVESTISERVSYFFRHLLQPNFLLLEELRETYEQQMDNLDFAAGDLLNRQIRVLDTYYDKLCMFHATRALSATIERDDVHIHIEHGRLAWVQREKGTTQIIARPEAEEPPAREYLAHDKTQSSERRAVYVALKEAMPDLVRSACDKSVQRFARVLKGDTHAED